MAEESQQLSPHIPVPLAFLICDQVISDERSKKKSIIGIFDQVLMSQFSVSTTYRPATLYFRGIDAEGFYNITIDYVRSRDDQRLAQAQIQLSVADRQKAMEFAVPLPPLPIPESGEYEFRLWANGHYIHRVRFTALERKSGGPQP